MKKIFRRALFMEDVEREGMSNEVTYMDALVTWAEWCDGMEVTDGYIGNFIIHEDWCEIVEE